MIRLAVPSPFRPLMRIVAFVLTIAALARELRRPPRRRTWRGRILGVPYDFRRPTWRRVRSAWWSPRDRHVLRTRAFGLGWAVNVGRLVRLGRGIAKST